MAHAEDYPVVGLFLGTVLSREDPENLDRVLVRVTDLAGLDQPVWAEATQGVGVSGAVLAESARVVVGFLGARRDQPVVLGTLSDPQDTN
jgi:hypothetical protein